jgi:hypothetical protein
MAGLPTSPCVRKQDYRSKLLSHDGWSGDAASGDRRLPAKGKEKRVRLRFRFQNTNRVAILIFVGLEKIKYNYSSIFEIKFKIYLNNDTKSVNF